MSGALGAIVASAEKAAILLVGSVPTHDPEWADQGGGRGG